MTDHQADLAAFVDMMTEPDDYPGDVDPAFEQPELDQARERWAVRSTSSAAWAARRYLAAKAEIEEAGRAAEEVVRAAREYVHRIEEREGRTMRFFEWKLREWYEANPPTGKSKTKRVPGAKLSSRLGGVSTVVTDADALREWLEEHLPEGLRHHEPDPDLALIKSCFGAKVDTGEGEYPAVVGPDTNPLVASAIGAIIEASSVEEVEAWFALDEETARPVLVMGEVVPGVEFVRGPEGFKVEGE